MTTSTKRLHKGFTLIELLTVIAIIGILAAIIIPTVGKVRETARRSVDSSNLRQVGQASLIFASDNRDLLPATTATFNAQGFNNSGGQANLKTVIGGLAASGGLNDAQIWFTGSESQNASGLSTVLSSNRLTLENAFINNVSATSISFNYIAGLNTNDPSTTPVAYTRGLPTNASTWLATGPYQSDGGHIVFLGGNVAFYRNTSNAFINATNGTQSSNLNDTRPRTAANAISFLTQ